MKFKIIAFKKLLGRHFNIPSYQRGYRWEKENVEALLNDIQEFAQKSPKDEGEFYCLQPVVVRKNKQLSGEKGVDIYDLLDGQQRLTTLWLILNAFKMFWDEYENDHPELYSMQFESRKDLLGKALDENSDSLENIDLFYLKEAYSTINSWNGNKKTISDTLNKGNDVRVIWYEFDKETDEESSKQASSINVFSRLNYGKIELTDTELIKALLLQSDIYPDDNSEVSRIVMKEHLFRIATEWDDIEKGLHDSSFWGMLTPEEYKPANRMELILRFVAERIQKEKNYSIIDKQRRDFHIISNYLGINSNTTPGEYASNVDSLWNRIRDAYNAMRNWYTNDHFYHLIGLLILMRGGSNPIPLIETIFENYNGNNKKSFKRYLESEIGKLIKIEETADESSGTCKRKLKINELVYGSHNARMIKILEAFNIYIHITHKYCGSRFNFKLFKDYKVTSLEHIHPQHLNFDENVSYDDVQSWYETTLQIIKSNAEYIKEESVTSTLGDLSSLLKNKEHFKNCKQQCQSAVEAIDAFFDTRANMVDGHMHTLYNMALVDKDTNAALSNKLIDTKRHILQEREFQGKTYVPIATNFVFNKHFSKDIVNMKFWALEDRNAYFLKIEEAYDHFTSQIEKSDKQHG